MLSDLVSCPVQVGGTPQHSRSSSLQRCTPTPSPGPRAAQGYQGAEGIGSDRAREVGMVAFPRRKQFLFAGDYFLRCLFKETEMIKRERERPTH